MLLRCLRAVACGVSLGSKHKVSTTLPAAVTIQTSPQSVPSTPSWLGEVAVIAHALRRLGVLATIEERVRFARRRFGQDVRH